MYLTIGGLAFTNYNYNIHRYHFYQAQAKNMYYLIKESCEQLKDKGRPKELKIQPIHLHSVSTSSQPILFSRQLRRKKRELNIESKHKSLALKLKSFHSTGS